MQLKWKMKSGYEIIFSIPLVHLMAKFARLSLMEEVVRILFLLLWWKIKLNLKSKNHLRPYKLSWLHKGNEVRVNKRCLVDFSIGKNYKDKVMCDVIRMDVCHLLLR